MSSRGKVAEKSGLGLSARQHFLLGASILSMCSLAAPALAQVSTPSSPAPSNPQAPPATTNGPASPASASLSEVVVTAQRRSENLQSVPIAVSALNAEALADQQISDTQDLQSAVPALRLTTNVTGPTDLQPAMRGAVEQNGGSLPTESPVGIYVDDIYVSSLIANNASLDDVQQVEVLRGPQGTLYGRNTLTGAIKFTTRTPGEQPWFEAGGGYGNYSLYDANFTAGGPLAAGLGGSLAADANGQNGFYTDVATGQRVGAENNYALHGKLHYFGVDHLDVVLDTFYDRDKNDGAVEIPGLPRPDSKGQFSLDNLIYVGGGPFKNATPTNTAVFGPVRSAPYGLTSQFITGVNAAYTFPGVTIRSITAYVRTTDNLTDDLSGSGGFWLGGSLAKEQFTEELQAQGTTFSSRLRYIGGLFFLHDDGNQTLGWLIGIPLSQTFTSERTDSYAAYGQVEYDVTQALTATVGLRGLEDVKYFNTSLLGIVVPSQGPVKLHNNYTAVTPKFELTYRVAPAGPLDTGLIYVSATKGFKAGGYNAVNVANLDQAFSPYGPETDWSYEAGGKGDFFNHKLRANLAVFLQRINGLQLGAPVVAPDGTISFPIQNAGAEQVVGAEVDLSARPTPNLLLGMTGSFLGGHYTQLQAGTAAASAITLYGKTVPPLLAPYTVTLTANYDVPFTLGDREARLSLGGDVYLSGKYFTGADNVSIVGSYARLNLYVAFAPSPQWEIRLSGKNLTNNVAFTTGAPSLGGYTVLPPRQVMISLKYKL